MEYGQVPGIDKAISRLVQGTMMISSRDLESSYALLDGVLELRAPDYGVLAYYNPIILNSLYAINLFTPDHLWLRIPQ